MGRTETENKQTLKVIVRGIVMYWGWRSVVMLRVTLSHIMTDIVNRFKSIAAFLIDYSSNKQERVIATCLSTSTGVLATVAFLSFKTVENVLVL